MKKEKKDLIILIDKLINVEGTENEQDEWINEIREAVPFYEKIINLIFWSDEVLTAKEIFEKAEAEHKPIIL